MEEYERNAVDLIEKLTDLQRKLSNFDIIQQKKHQDEIIESYWNTGNELESAGRHILHTGKLLNHYNVEKGIIKEI